MLAYAAISSISLQDPALACDEGRNPFFLGPEKRTLYTVDICVLVRRVIIWKQFPQSQIKIGLSLHQKRNPLYHGHILENPS